MRNWLTLETGGVSQKGRKQGKSWMAERVGHTILDTGRRISDVRRDLGSLPPSPFVARIRPYAPRCAAIPSERRSRIAFRKVREGTPIDSRSAVCALFVRAVCALCTVCSGALRAVCVCHMRAANCEYSKCYVHLANERFTHTTMQSTTCMSCHLLRSNIVRHALIKLIALTMCIRIPFRQGRRTASV